MAFYLQQYWVNNALLNELFHSKPLPLAAIYFLGNRQPELAAASIEAISPQIGLMHLMTHRYPQSVKLDRDRQDRELAMLGRLVTVVPMRQIHRRDSLAGLSQLCDVILEDMVVPKIVWGL